MNAISLREWTKSIYFYLDALRLPFEILTKGDQ